MNDFEKLLEQQREANERRRICCDNCCWYAAVVEGGASGKCFRYPPVRAKGNWDFPAVSKDFLCGEFQHKKTGETMRGEVAKYGMLRARVAELEDRIDRMRRDDEHS